MNWRGRCLLNFANLHTPMADLPTLEAAMALADQDCPLPQLAGPALKVLRAEIENLRFQPMTWPRCTGNPTSCPENNGAGCCNHYGSATLTALIAELRAREALGRTKYGTDVDRTDFTNGQWRQHLREELMDALLYSLAEQRTAPPMTWDDSLVETLLAMAQPRKPACWCNACHRATITNIRMVLCPTCGNKRCPHANDHRNACTGSNAVGQPGSSWEHVKPAAPPAEDC